MIGRALIFLFYSSLHYPIAVLQSQHMAGIEQTAGRQAENLSSFGVLRSDNREEFIRGEQPLSLGEQSSHIEEAFGQDETEIDSLTLYLRDIYAIPPLTREEKSLLKQRILNGDDTARIALAEGHYRWVVKRARRFLGMGGMSFLELIQAGNMGLLQAARKYDPKKGEFSTYSKHDIDGSIAKELSKKLHDPLSSGNIPERKAHDNYIGIGKYDESTDVLAQPSSMVEMISQLIGDSWFTPKERTVLQEIIRMQGEISRRQLAEILLGVSEERVRQLFQNGTNKLRILLALKRQGVEDVASIDEELILAEFPEEKHDAIKKLTSNLKKRPKVLEESRVVEANNESNQKSRIEITDIIPDFYDQVSSLLSPAEVRILQLIQEGKKNIDIAARFSLTPGSFKNTLTRIRRVIEQHILEVNGLKRTAVFKNSTIRSAAIDGRLQAVSFLGQWHTADVWVSDYLSQKQTINPSIVAKGYLPLFSSVTPQEYSVLKRPEYKGIRHKVKGRVYIHIRDLKRFREERQTTRPIPDSPDSTLEDLRNFAKSARDYKRLLDAAKKGKLSVQRVGKTVFTNAKAVEDYYKEKAGREKPRQKKQEKQLPQSGVIFTGK